MPTVTWAELGRPQRPTEVHHKYGMIGVSEENIAGANKFVQQFARDPVFELMDVSACQDTCRCWRLGQIVNV